MNTHPNVFFRRREPRGGKSRLSRTLCAASLVVLATAAGAAGQAMSEAQALYQAERAACTNGSSNQDRATCLKEASAAYQAARSGQLSAAGGQGYANNSRVRCDPLPAPDREDCLRRMSGEGSVSGSAKGGGMVRELATPVAPAPAR